MLYRVYKSNVVRDICQFGMSTNTINVVSHLTVNATI